MNARRSRNCRSLEIVHDAKELKSPDFGAPPAWPDSGQFGVISPEGTSRSVAFGADFKSSGDSRIFCPREASAAALKAILKRKPGPIYRARPVRIGRSCFPVRAGRRWPQPRPAFGRAVLAELGFGFRAEVIAEDADIVVPDVGEFLVGFLLEPGFQEFIAGMVGLQARLFGGRRGPRHVPCRRAFRRPRPRRPGGRGRGRPRFRPKSRACRADRAVPRARFRTPRPGPSFRSMVAVFSRMARISSWSFAQRTFLRARCFVRQNLSFPIVAPSIEP